MARLISCTVRTPYYVARDIVGLVAMHMHTIFGLSLIFRFELKFKECISSAAIKIKFEQHHKRGSEVVQDLEQLVTEEETSAIKIG